MAETSATQYKTDQKLQQAMRPNFRRIFSDRAENGQHFGFVIIWWFFNLHSIISWIQWDMIISAIIFFTSAASWKFPATTESFYPVPAFFVPTWQKNLVKRWKHWRATVLDWLPGGVHTRKCAPSVRAPYMLHTEQLPPYTVLYLAKCHKRLTKRCIVYGVT
jgi:hypothetical protein